MPNVLQLLPLTLEINVFQLSLLSLHLNGGSSQLLSMLLEFLSVSLPIPRLSLELYQMLFADLQSTRTTFFVQLCILLVSSIKLRTTSNIPSPCIKPNFISSVVKIYLNLFPCTFSTIFIACSSGFTPLYIEQSMIFPFLKK